MLPVCPKNCQQWLWPQELSQRDSCWLWFGATELCRCRGAPVHEDASSSALTLPSCFFQAPENESLPSDLAGKYNPYLIPVHCVAKVSEIQQQRGGEL